MIKLIVLDIVESKLKKDGKFWIAFVGDSLTSCEWVHPNWREIVEYVLKNELQRTFENWRVPSWGIRCFNYGYDGSTSQDIVEKIDKILEHGLEMAIVMIGGNDKILGVSLEEHGKNLKMIEDRLRDNEVAPIMMTCTKPWNEASAGRYEPYVELDRTLGLTNFVDLYEESDKFPKERIYTFRSEAIPEEDIEEGDLDFMHPNPLGNAYIAKVVLEKVFGISFDPEKYITENLAGEKYPEY